MDRGHDESHGVPNMNCQDATQLVPSYLDEELSEAQAAPFRSHLMSCPPCRAEVQDLKSIRAWFVPPPEVSVPEGFAARVARRAFAGDPGLEGLNSQSGTSVPAVAESEERHGSQGEPGRILSLAMQLSALAAAAAILLSIAVFSESVPNRPLQADVAPEDGHQLDELLNQLREDRDGQVVTPATGSPSAGADSAGQ